MKKTETGVTVKFKGYLDKEQFSEFAKFVFWYKKDYEKKNPQGKSKVEITSIKSDAK